jgi:hypothetical protein
MGARPAGPHDSGGSYGNAAAARRPSHLEHPKAGKVATVASVQQGRKRNADGRVSQGGKRRLAPARCRRAGSGEAAGGRVSLTWDGPGFASCASCPAAPAATSVAARARTRLRGTVVRQLPQAESISARCAEQTSMDAPATERRTLFWPRAKRECAAGCRNFLSRQDTGADHQQLTGDDAKVELTFSLLQHSLDNPLQLRQDAPD